jgi:hypothetical protein
MRFFEGIGRYMEGMRPTDWVNGMLTAANLLVGVAAVIAAIAAAIVATRQLEIAEQQNRLFQAQLDARPILKLRLSPTTFRPRRSPGAPSLQFKMEFQNTGGRAARDLKWRITITYPRHAFLLAMQPGRDYKFASGPTGNTPESPFNVVIVDSSPGPVYANTAQYIVDVVLNNADPHEPVGFTYAVVHAEGENTSEGEIKTTVGELSSGTLER